MSGERWRLFLAAPLPGDVGARLWQSLEPVRAEHPGARWTSAEQYHVTLVFLGATASNELARVTRAMNDVSRRVANFEAVAETAGGPAGRRGGGVAWLSIGAGRAELSGLALHLDEGLASRTFAERAPHPHVTLARGADRALLEALRERESELRVRWAVDAIVLFRSQTGPAGSRYEQLATSELRGAERSA